MRCAHCDREFTPKNRRRRFCSSACRGFAWRVGRTDTLQEALRHLEAASALLRQIGNPRRTR
jgi:hypothetical protein